MQTIHRPSFFKKTIHILLVYVLLLDTMVPSIYAMRSLSYPDHAYTEFLTTGVTRTVFMEKSHATQASETWEKDAVISAAPYSPATHSSSGAQPEVSGFSITSTDGMVDKFTGDFSYSIPLVDAEGYPVTLTYNSNVSMLDEASWVGLGWNLNVGSISRDMRGIPDDFNGEDVITREFNQENLVVTGNKNGGYTSIGFGMGSSFGAGIGVSFLGGKYNNNYLGTGKTYDLNIGVSARYSIASDALFLSPSVNLGMSYDSKNGIGSTFGLGLNATGNIGAGTGAIGGVSYNRTKNSRYGMQNQSVSFSTLGPMNAKASSSSTFTYGTATSLPRVYFNSATDSYNFEMDFYAGTTLPGVSMRAGYLRQDYNSSSKMLYHLENDKKIFHPAYGYFHSGKRKSYLGNYFPMMDFNRGVENEYSEEMRTLPFSVQTHDVFYVNGMGINGTFRGMRTDYGTYYDPDSESTFNNDSQLYSDDDVSGMAIGVTYTPPMTIGFGIAYSTATMKANQNSGNWNNGGNLLEFTSEAPSHLFDNTVYFKPIGSVAPVDMQPWEMVNGNTADYFDINAIGNQMEQDNYLKVKNSNVTSSGLNSFHGRTYSDIYFKPATVAELTAPGTPASVSHYQSVSPSGNETLINRSDSQKKNNHISAVDVVTPNGVRYQYGIPVYNYRKSEVTFSCEGRPELTENGIPSGIIEYQSGDNSINNSLSIRKYFDKTTLPPYAQAFLLTQVVSSDYIDRQNDGPTIDDVGNYYLFKYTRAYGPDNLYGTRFPISGTSSSGKKAFYAKGALGTNRDNLANYTYQESEIWYTHSIETKNLVVEFHLDDRKDAYSADENGILQEDKPMKRLSKIVVYNRQEKKTNPNALPLQTIRFYHNYTLCPGAPGNLNTYNGSGLPSGKLTLEEIRIFNGDSYENALSSIHFEYASGADNPPFSYANTDAWGQNKPNTTIKPNDLYPYADQRADEANQAARAWKLTAITNPMGGRIEIDYESDSYAYVQDERSMRNFDVYRMTDLFDFFKIRKDQSWNGVNRAGGGAMEETFHHNYGSLSNLLSENGIPSPFGPAIQKEIFDKQPSSLYNGVFGQFDISLVPNNVIIFKLDSPLNGNLSQQEADKLVLNSYFRDPNNPSKEPVTELYTRMYVKIKEGVYDLVPVMSSVSNPVFHTLFSNYILGSSQQELTPSYGAMPPSPQGNYEYGYVIVDPVHTGAREKKGTDKVKKGTIAMHPMQLTALEYARATLVDKVYGSDPDSEGDMSIDWKVFFGNDMYKYMVSDAGYCTEFTGNRSCIRLNEPDYTKYGGGTRVKEIRYFDNWEQLSGEYNSQYSWRYKYSTTINREEYSTGVAAFEPMAIIDENPFNDWIKYVNIKKKFPDENRFVPGPVDYQLYPKPVVGYEKVEVTFIEAGNYGKSVTKYYTAKDHPTVSRSTTIDKSAKIKKNNIITGKVRDIYGITQGYVTETNDFHGKIRLAEVSKKNLQNEDITISKTVYDYYGKGEQVKMAERSGEIKMYNAAIEYDIHADSKYYTDENKFFQMGLDFVLNWTPLFGFYPNFSPIFSMGSRERAFYSHALIKHINYSAVLKSVTTEYLGSVNTTQTTVFDIYTGTPVVSQLTDEYNDRLYQVNYPSHWKYKELRELDGANGRSTTINLGLNGYFTPSPVNANDALTPGDIVLVDGYRLQVSQNWPWPEDGRLFLVTPEDGSIYIPTASGDRPVVILKSARDNRLLETMQGFTTKVNPATGTFITCPENQILSASAITYRDRLSSECFCNELTPGMQYNPYNYGMRGDLVVDRQFAWQSERAADDPHGIRFDGAYRTNNPSEANFVLFYESDNAGKWSPIHSASHSGHSTSDPYRNWRPLGNSTLFDKYANAVEAKDQINVYSSVLTGYGDTYNALVTAQAVNAMRRQIAFDGFEDYTLVEGDLRCRSTVPGSSHFDYFQVTTEPESGISIDHTVRHSGLASLKINASKTAAVTKTISSSGVCSPVELTDVIVEKGVGMDSCACLPTFSPTPGKYVIGAWIHGNPQTSQVEVQIAGGGTFAFQPDGPEIDGWRRVEGVFTIPPGAGAITVSLKNAHTSAAVFFDDLRIHPFLAGMQTTVYDPVTFLPLATHDGYNFTTYYNYDENLNLVRIRVETVEGIKTVMEQESGSLKSYPIHE